MRLFMTADCTEGRMSYKSLSWGGGYYCPILWMRKLRASPLVTRER